MDEQIWEHQHDNLEATLKTLMQPAAADTNAVSWIPRSSWIGGSFRPTPARPAADTAAVIAQTGTVLDRYP